MRSAARITGLLIGWSIWLSGVIAVIVWSWLPQDRLSAAWLTVFCLAGFVLGWSLRRLTHVSRRMFREVTNGA